MKKISLWLIVSGLMLTAQIYSFGQSKNSENESDSAAITISLKRDGFPCGIVPNGEKDLSGCPAYSIIIDGDGTVTYEGVASVKTQGKRILTISRAEVRQLIKDFEDIKFFELPDKYISKQMPDGSSVTVDHSNGTTVTLKIGNKTKSVYNFYGAPPEFEALQKKLEAISAHLQR